MTEQQFTDSTIVGGWCIPNEEREEYVGKREEMMLFLETTFKAMYKNVCLGGEGSEDGDYISANEGEKESLFIHFDPSEVEAFHTFEDKHAYLEMKWLIRELEKEYDADETKEQLEGDKLFEDWQHFIITEYKKKTGKDYPYSY